MPPPPLELPMLRFSLALFLAIDYFAAMTLMMPMLMLPYAGLLLITPVAAITYATMSFRRHAMPLR